MCGSEPWKNHSYTHTKTISTALFLDHFIHILQLHSVFMWGTTSRYPTPTAAFIITGCCLATDEGSEFWGENDKRRVGKQIKSNIKMLSLSIQPKVSEYPGMVCTPSEGLETSHFLNIFKNRIKQDLTWGFISFKPLNLCRHLSALFCDFQSNTGKS